MPGRLQRAAAKLGLAEDGAGFHEVNAGVVVGIEPGLVEVIHAAAGEQMRASRSGLQRLHFDAVLAEGEMSFGGPGDRAIVGQPSVGFPQQDVGLVTPVKKGVGHVGRNVVHDKLHGVLLVVPQKFPASYFETIDGDGKKTLDGILYRGGFLPGFRLVGRAVWIKDDVNHRVFDDQRIETELGSQDGDHFDLCEHAVEVNIRHLAGSLGAMNREVTNVDSELHGNGMNAPQIDAPSGNAFEFDDQAPAHHLLKGIGGDVPGGSSDQEASHASGDKQIPPKLPGFRLGAGVHHRACGVEEGQGACVRISLLARRFCSQAVSS